MRSWAAINTILRNLSWIIFDAVLFSVLLLIPNQVQELYRIAADQGGAVAIQFLSTVLIAVVIWLIPD